MKKSFTILVAVLVTLCTTSTALAQTPTPSSNEGIKIDVPSTPRMYYSEGLAPVFLTHLSNVSAIEGQSVLLQVKFSGDTPLYVEFLRNGRPGSEWGSAEKHMREVVKDDDSQGIWIARLLIIEAEEEDSAEYAIRLINFSGEVTSSAKVTITAI